MKTKCFKIEKGGNFKRGCAEDEGEKNFCADEKGKDPKIENCFVCEKDLCNENATSIAAPPTSPPVTIAAPATPATTATSATTPPTLKAEVKNVTTINDKVESKNGTSNNDKGASGSISFDFYLIALLITIGFIFNQF